MFKPDQHNPFSDDLGYLGDYGLQPHTNPGIHPNPSLRVPLPNPAYNVKQLKKGDSGPQVVTLHEAFLSHPSIYGGSTENANAFRATNEYKDRKFGPKTKEIVEVFQEMKGLTVDGIVGPQTWGALAHGSNSYLPGGSTLPAPPPPKQQKKTPIHQQEWFVPVVAGLSILIVGGLIIRSIK